MANYIFLSYAVEDRAYTEELARRLRTEAGVESWWFQGKQEPGILYMQELTRRIADCLAVVVVLSPASASSEGVLDELGYARAMKKRVIPIVIGRQASSESLTAHVRSGPVTYSLRKLDMIDGDTTEEVIPRLRRFLQGATIPQPITGEGGVSGQGASLLSGYTIKGYQFGMPLAQTNSSVVYRARELSIDRSVAIKVVLPATPNREIYNRRFEAEARRVAGLEHPHIIPLYNYWREEDNAFLVMRLLSEGSLGDLLARGPLSLRGVASIFSQVISGLSLAHAHRIIHRDIKPGNILIDKAKNAYLSDFGIAQEAAGGSGPSSLGGFTVGYAPPEQVAGAPANPQADIYAMAALLYEMLTSERAFPGADNTTILQRQFNGEVPSLMAWSQAHGRALPATLDAAIRKGLAHDPADRFTDVQSFAEAVREGLLAALRGEGLAEPSARQVVQPEELRGAANPYKALRPFDEADSSDFFGREALAAQLAGRLARDGEAGRFLAVVGPSGSGKSSVVRAGLVPAVRRQAGRFVAMLTPGDRPLERIAEALAEATGGDAAELLVLIYADEGGLVRAVNKVLPAGQPAELLLVIDQFEELYTLVTEPVTRRFVLASLAALVADPRGRTRLVITLRADFYDRPLSDPLFSRLMEGRTETVMPLSAAELEDAIARPAARVGTAVEPALVRELIADVQAQPGALPLLQYALHALYDACDGAPLTLAAYQQGGGLRGVIERQADEVMGSLSPPRRALARQVFLRLVTPGDGVEDTRRRVRQSELAALTTGQEGEAERAADSSEGSPLAVVLGRFGEKRLLTFDYEPGTREPTVEIAHEALLQGWNDLRGWLNEARAFLRTQRRLSEAAADWLRQSRNPAYLAGGGPLAQFEELEQRAILALNPVEREYIARSRAAEAERQERELAQARALAEEQRQRADEKAASEQRLRRQAGVLRILLGGAGTLALIALILFVVALQQQQRAEANADLAATSAAIAEANAAEAADNAAVAEQARESADLASFQMVTADISAQQQDLGVLLGLEAYRDSATSAQGESTSALLTVLTGQPELSGFLRAHIGTVNAVAYSPGGDMLASAGFDQGILLWGLADSQPLGPPMFSSADGSIRGHKAAVRSLAFSPDGALLASAGNDDRVIIWDVAQRQPIAEIADAYGVLRAVFSPDGKLLAWGQCAAAESCEAAEIRFWDVAARQAGPPPLAGFGGLTFDLAFSPNGRQMISGGTDNLVHVWNLADRSNDPGVFKRHTDDVYAVAFSPDGRRAVSGGRDATLVVYDMDALTASRPIVTGGSSVVTVAFRPGGRMFASAGFDDRILLWDLTGDTPSLLGEPLEAHTAAIQDLAFSPDGRSLASGSRDASVVLWDLSGAGLFKPLANHAPARQTATLSPNGRTLVTGGIEPQIQFWDLATGRQSAQPIAVDAPINALASSEQRGGFLAAGDANGNITIWTLTGERRLRFLNTEADAISSLAISPDGALLAYGTRDGRVAIYDIETSTVRWSAFIKTNADDSPAALSIAFSGDNALLYSGDGSGQMIFWSVADGARAATVQAHKAAIFQLAYNAQASLLAVGSFDDTVTLWDLTTGERRSLLTLGADVLSVALSPDGGRLAAGTRDGTITLYNTADGSKLGPAIEGQGEPMVSLAFSGADTLVANDQKGLLTRWQVPANTAIGDPVDSAGIGSGYALAFRPGADSRALVSGGGDGQVMLTDIPDEAGATTVKSTVLGGLSEEYNALSVAVRADGTIAAGMGNGQVLLWLDGQTEEPAQRLTISEEKKEEERAAITATAFSADGSLLAAGDGEGQVWLWEVSDLSQPRPLLLSTEILVHQGVVNSVAFSPDGRFLASGGEDQTVAVWDINNLLQIGTLREQGGVVYGLAFSPDSSILATAGGDDKVFLWDTASWTPLGSPMIGHTESIRSVAFSPDGSLLATGSFDQTIILWDVAARRPIGSPIPIGGTVWSVAFHPGGDSLAFAADDQEVSLLNLSSAALRERACTVAARTLSWAEWQTYRRDRPYDPACADRALAYGALLKQADDFAQAARADADLNGAARAEAERLYGQAVEALAATESMILNNQLCLEGSINGFAALVLPACERAVALTDDLSDPLLAASNARARDSYGVALALSGKYVEAILEFQEYVAWTEKPGNEEDYKRYGKKREEWIEALGENQNPFDEQTLANLRIE